MAWRELTTDDLLAALSGPEVTALRTKALGDGQNDPVDQALASAVLMVRDRIAAHRGNKLAAGNTLPEGMVRVAVAIARWDILTRLNVESLMTPQREGQYKDALAELRDVAAGRVSIETPEEADDTPRQAVRPRINGRTSAFKRAQQDGI